MVKHFLVVISLAMVFVLGCKKKDDVVRPEIVPSHTSGVYVLNEGNFGKLNSTLSLFVTDSNKVYQDVFGAINHRSIGDTGNDITLFGTTGFIVVNNSNKVEVFSTETNTSLATIQLPNKSPRHIVVVDASKAFITNWGDNTVAVINPTTFAVIKDSITVGNSPEGIATASGKVYVCNYGFGSDSTVSVLDASTFAVLKTIVVGPGPQSIGVDADGDLFVECSGYSDWKNSANDTPGSVVVIDPKKDSIVTKIIFALAAYGHPKEVVVSKNGYALVSLKNGLAKIDTKTNTLIKDNFIITASAYAIAVDDVTDNVYVADAKDYAQAGEVKIYDKNGAVVTNFSVGIIPGHFAFKK